MSRYSCVAPQTTHDYLQLAAYGLEQGHIKDARAALHQASALADDDPGIYRALMQGYRAAGLPDDATIAELAALAFEQSSRLQSALMLYNLGTMFLMTQRPVPAEKWLRVALRYDPSLVTAHQNLASILELDGNKAEAQFHRDQAYQRQNVFIDTAATPTYTILVLCAAATGNVPIEFLLPAATITRIKWVMDYARGEQADHFPAYDLVFNAIGDQDVTAQSSAVVQGFLQRCTKPVLNLPHAIARTSREQIAGMLQGIDALMVPPVARLSASAAVTDFAETLRAYGILAPLLVRPVGSHGGRGLQIWTDAQTLNAQDFGDQDYYFSNYCDYRSADGYYRKYRVIFIDRIPFPYHLAISSHWQVHYASADMLSQAWKRDEEQRFLENPQAVLGPAAMQALRVIGQRLNLDYCGIDFSLLEDGRILLFEANATMLVHLEQFHAALQYKNRYVQRILDAFACMLQNRIN